MPNYQITYEVTVEVSGVTQEEAEQTAGNLLTDLAPGLNNVAVSKVEKHKTKTVVRSLEGW